VTGPVWSRTWLDRLDPPGRYALLKLVTGGLRMGLSSRLIKQALADFGAKSTSTRSRNCGTG
jgi:DNA ligase-1